MSSPAAFSGAAYELTTKSGVTFALSHLSAEDGHRLGTAVAGMFPWSDYAYPASALARFLATSDPGALRFAFAVDGEIVGAAVVRPIWLRGPYLNFIALLPVAQRRGIGGAFLDWMEREARTAEDRNMWVAASEINADAIRLYERHGFEETTRLDGLVCDDRTEILFRKRLS
jgi:diamine N-acetyltransferase